MPEQLLLPSFYTHYDKSYLQGIRENNFMSIHIITHDNERIYW